MNITRLKNIVCDSRTVVPAAFLLSGAAKMYSDYKIAKPEKKKSIFIKDATILTGSALASLSAYYLIKKTPGYDVINHVSKFLGKGIEKLKNTAFMKEKIIPKITFLYKPVTVTGNAVKHSLSSIERAIKDCIGAACLTLAAFGGALAANELLTKIIFAKRKPQETQEKTAVTTDTLKQETEKEEKRIARYMKFVDDKVAKDSANNVFSAIIKDIPTLKMLDKPLVALAGFDIIKEKTFEDKFKKTTHELIANTLIPTFIISAVTAITQNMHNVIRIPLIILSAVGGAFAGKHVGEQVNDKFPEHLNYKEMLKNWHGLKLW